MKRLIQILLLCICYTTLQAQTQYLGSPTTTIEVRGTLKNDSVFLPPADTLASAANGSIAFKGSSVYYKTGGKWIGLSAYLFQQGLTNTSGTISNDFYTGKSGGDTLIGGTAFADALTILPNNNATFGNIYFGHGQGSLFNDRISWWRFRKDGVTSASDSAGILIDNSSPATSGLSQPSPMVRMRGFGWNTVALASQPVDYRTFINPISANPPTITLTQDFRTNSGSWVNATLLDNAGNYTIKGIMEVDGAFIKGPGATFLMSTGTTRAIYAPASNFIQFAQVGAFPAMNFDVSGGRMKITDSIASDHGAQDAGGLLTLNSGNKGLILPRLNGTAQGTVGGSTAGNIIWNLDSNWTSYRTSTGWVSHDPFLAPKQLLFDSLKGKLIDTTTQVSANGDSYMVGVGAGGGGPSTMAALTATHIGKNLNNIALGGSGMVNAQWQYWINYPNNRVAAMASFGLNDVSKTSNITRTLLSIIPEYTGFIANHFLGWNIDADSSIVTKSGTWTSANLVTGSPVRPHKAPYIRPAGKLVYSKTPGDYITTAFTGNNVVIFTMGGDHVHMRSGRFDVYIDNRYLQTVYTDSIGDGSSTAVINGPVFYDHYLVPFAKVITGLGGGNHVLRLQISAGVTDTTYIDAIGTMVDPKYGKKLVMAEAPHLRPLGYTTQSPSNPKTDATMDSANVLIDSAINFFIKLNYPVRIMKTINYFPQGLADYSADSLHPSFTGHAHYAVGLGNGFDSLSVNSPLLYRVYTDSTLKGDGTSTSPLGVTFNVRRGIGSGAAPTAGSLGTNVTSITPTGTDRYMQLTVVTSGAVNGTLGVITFASDWPNTPLAVIGYGDAATTGPAVAGTTGGYISFVPTSTTQATLSGKITSAGTYVFNVIVGGN